MSSPGVRKQSTSPIRNLDNKSPQLNKRLHTIVQQQGYLARPHRLQLLERQNNSLNYQNVALSSKMRNYAEEATRFIIENSRLAQQNQTLRDMNYRSNVIETQKLTRQIYLKDVQIQNLKGNIGSLRAHYDRSLQHFKLQNEGLKNQLIVLQTKKFDEVQQIKTKYTAIAQQDMNLARRGYYQDLARLMSNLQSNKLLLGQKQKQIKHLTFHGQNLVKQHSIYLQQLVSQNNVLRNHILQIQIKRDNQVKQAQSKRELQKSRTQGIITFCKQNSAYIEKQVSRLAEQLLQKSITIDQFTKDMLKIRRNLQLTQRKYQQKIQRLQKESDDKLLQKQKQRQKLDKYHKQQMADMKKIQMQLQEVIATKQNELDSLQRQNQHNIKIINQKNANIDQLKANLSKLHEDHAKQISKVMTDSRVKRKSMKNLSSSSSLRDLSADGNSSIIKKPTRQNSILQNRQGSSGQLYTVHQQLAASQLVHNQQQEDGEDVAMKDLIIHYQNIIQQIKNNKALQINIAHETIQKLNLSLRQKQQELLEILQRFSPLMQYKLNSQSIEEQRKQKIEKHYKANVDLLSVMLDKYSIAAISKKK